MKIDRDKIIRTRDAGKSLSAVAKECGCSVSTVKRVLKEEKPQEPKFPCYAEARVVKPVPNQRLILVEFDGITQPAIKPMGQNYPLGSRVSIERIDERTCKVI